MPNYTQIPNWAQALGQGAIDLGQGLTTIDKQNTDRRTALQKAVDDKAEAYRKDREFRLKEAEALQKANDAADQSAAARSQGALLQNGVPTPATDVPGPWSPAAPGVSQDPTSGLPSMHTPASSRPATADEILAAGAPGMNPYQIAALSQKPFMAQQTQDSRTGMESAKHDNRMSEIEARGRIQKEVADTYARNRLRYLSASHGAGTGNAQAAADMAQQEIPSLDSDIAKMVASKPDFDMDGTWRAQYNDAIGMRKHLQRIIAAAYMKGAQEPGGVPAPGGSAFTIKRVVPAR